MNKLLDAIATNANVSRFPAKYIVELENATLAKDTPKYVAGTKVAKIRFDFQLCRCSIYDSKDQITEEFGFKLTITKPIIKQSQE